MEEHEVNSYIENPSEMSVISAAKKYAEVLRAIHTNWANQDPDFDLDLSGFDFHAKHYFLNDYFSFFSAIQGNVKNRTSPILDAELRNKYVSTAKKLYVEFIKIVAAVDKNLGDNEKISAIKTNFSALLMQERFPECSREMFNGLRPEVNQLDSWVSEIISEVVTSSYFGFGAPLDADDAVFYLYLKDKDEHVAASLLIGASFMEEWLQESPTRGIIGRNELDDDEAFDRES